MKIRWFALLSLAAVVCFAQEFRGSISGATVDATGALVPGVKLTVTEVNTNAKVEAVSDSGGHYRVPLLLAGDYDIVARLEGFKESSRKGVHLGAGEQPVIDIKLEVGDSRQIVEVTADAPLVNSENASVGQVITTRDIEDLPSNGNTPTAMVFFAPGVVLTGQPNQILPFASGGAASFSMGGMPNQQNELLVDGVPNTTWDGRLAYSPPRDAVQEVRTKVFDTDAAYGRTAGGTANTILRSGTNQLHGSVSYYNQPSNMVANDFFRNKAALPAQLTHFNQGGLSVSGPLYVPKIFDGRNKVFWMFGFEDIQSSSPATSFLAVPTDGYRKGDFAQLLKIATPTILYDPYSATQAAGSTTITRTAFPNNKIPDIQLNPIALKYQELIPAANITNTSIVRADGFQNFGNNSPTKDGFTNELGRLDFNIGARSRTYFNVRHTDYFQSKNDYFSNLLTGSNLSRSNWGGSLDQVMMLDASNILNVRLNFTRMFEDHSAPSAGFNPASIGFPAYLASNSQYLQIPMMSFANSSGWFPNLGMNGANTLPSQSMQLFGSWVAVRGNHSFKAGADLRQYRLNYKSYGNATGQLSFNGNSWVRGKSTDSSTVAFGQDWASFLLGLPYSGSGSVYDINASAMFYQYYSGVFVQDDWRARRNLTLNFGIRFDHDSPYREKWGRTVNGFDYNSSSPLETAAKAAYAASPSPLLAASDFKVRGGLAFASPGDNGIFKTTSHIVSPRLGFAWTPARLGGTVIRGGFGMFVAPTSIAQLGASGSYSTNPLLTQQGFSQQTSMTPTNDNYYHVAATLSDPYPTGIRQPAGSSQGLLTYAGQAISYFNSDLKNPYSLRWNLSVQREISKNLLVEILYLGSHTVHLPVSYTQMNGLPRQFMSTMQTRDTALNTAMSATVNNPFFGLQTATATSKTITTAQLLANYPQFPVYTGGNVTSGTSGVVQYSLNNGSSRFSAMNARVEKRFSGGLKMSASYMKSRIIDQNTWLNAQDPVPEVRNSPFDHPTVIKMTMSYELPVGQGKWLNLNSRVLNLLIGGWKTAATYTYQTGQPIVWSGASDYVYYGGDLKWNNRNVDGPSLDATRFETNSANQFAYHLRTFSSTFMNLRQDGVNQFDASILKDFGVGEKRSLQIKCDAFNVVNHPTFAAANTNVTNTGFGLITAVSNRPRALQLGVRILF